MRKIKTPRQNDYKLKAKETKKKFKQNKKQSTVNVYCSRGKLRSMVIGEGLDGCS